MDENPLNRTQPLRIPAQRARAPRRMQWLAGAIALAGVIAAIWYQRAAQAPEQHAENPAFERIEEPRVELIDGLRSYEAEFAISTPLEAAGLSAQRQVFEKPASGRYPTRRMVTLTVPGYRHLGIEGELSLEFFNDRLMEANFRPADAGSYARRLHEALPLLETDRVGKAELVAGDLRVWSNVDLARSRVGGSLRTEALVIWQDLRLIRQRDDWDARFGHIAAPSGQ